LSSQIEKGAHFARIHTDAGIVVLPNAWDAGSAIMMAEAGFRAIATTSAGIAFAMGLPDGQHVSRDAMLDHVARIVAAVPVPVTADLEAGYGPAAEDVEATVRGALRAGVVGCNIEDATGNPEKPLFEIEQACDRIRAGSEVARRANQPFVLNARTDPFLVRRGADAAANFAEAVRRANAYREAGADCLFVPGPMDADTIGKLVREIDGPLNVLGARGGSASALGIADLERLGVKRVSVGGSLSVAVLAFVRQTMQELRERGTFGYAQAALSNATVNALMVKYRAG
jgi:2-methylisocitrate lyase-like PEP mutase family enzyme